MPESPASVLLQNALDHVQSAIDANLEGACKRKGLIRLQALYVTLRELQDLLAAETSSEL